MRSKVIIDQERTVIIGGGPAGLTAAYELVKAGRSAVVLEKDHVVGGLARTVNHNGYRFDIGGHRFFTKVKIVDDMWREVLTPREFLRRDRLSRIYYNGKFFFYPLKPANALFGLGIWNSILVLFSYLKAQISPRTPEVSFEDWVSNRFGRRLYEIFFKTYTEKVWGIPCSELSAEWAAQRIKGLSLITAVWHALFRNKPKEKNKTVKTLIDAFDYPAQGPGMMWERVAKIVTEHGSSVRLGTDVERIVAQDDEIAAVEIVADGRREEVKGGTFISSMPIRELIQKLDPAPPEKVRQAANSLHYRDFLTVALIVDKPDTFPDNWIYIHDPSVKVGRIQNFKNWSPHMVPDPQTSCLGLEYFCFEGDGLWTMSDQALVAMAKAEVAKLGLVRAEDVREGVVVRLPKAYPVYDSTYLDALKVVRSYLERFRNLQLVGRNGMHKYNNQDHSMLTAMLAVKNILGANHDLWKVNADQEYHEECRAGECGDEEIAALASSQPLVPARVNTSGD